MAMAADLVTAAKLTAQQIVISIGGPGSDFSEDQMKVILGDFIDDTLPLFPDTPPVNRVVGDWLIPMSSVQSTLSSGNAILQLTVLDEIIDLVSKMCFAGNTAQITVAQQTALLAAWNSAFGT